jgi:hypothetical protein
MTGRQSHVEAHGARAWFVYCGLIDAVSPRVVGQTKRLVAETSGVQSVFQHATTRLHAVDITTNNSGKSYSMVEATECYQQ